MIPKTELTVEEEIILDIRGIGWKVAASKRLTKVAGFKEGILDSMFMLGDLVGLTIPVY